MDSARDRKWWIISPQKGGSQQLRKFRPRSQRYAEAAVARSGKVEASHDLLYKVVPTILSGICSCVYESYNFFELAYSALFLATANVQISRSFEWLVTK